MICMAKTKQTTEKIVSSRKGIPLNAWIPEELMESLNKRCAETRRSKTAEVIIALEKHLKPEAK